MRAIDYEAEVQVQILHKFPKGNRWREIHMWDGVGLADAVRRVRALPPSEQAGATIFAPTGMFGIEAIQEIFERPDFPGF
ncbi:MAG TPA: hypothetical protein VMH84_18020 [Xanthobacteraceae bacterium]|nr:hypothetical protein [Xanthobacteraceae bacterium]